MPPDLEIVITRVLASLSLILLRIRSIPAGSVVEFQSSLESVSKFLTENLQPGDLALFLGAGNLNQIIPEVMAFYQQADRPD